MPSPSEKTSPTGDTKRWYVLYTKPRHEKRLAERLSADGFDVYCPLKRVVRQWSDRKKVVEEPLFPSFFFIHCLDTERELVFKHASAVRYLYWLRKPAIVQNEEIDTLKSWLEGGQVENVQIEDYRPGARVRFQSGPFQNEEATINEVRNTQAIVVLEQLGIQVRIDLRQTAVLAL